MKFDIARQPLVPAFLTLAALAVVAMWSAGGPAVSMAVQAGHAAGTVDIGRNAAGALAVSSPGELLAQFQAAHPVWARWIAGLLMLFTGMSVGRLTVRYNLYSVGTCLAIPLYGAIACGLAVGGDCLTTFAASALLALATKNFCRSYCNGFGFDAIFRASLYIGLLPLVATAAAPLLILLPLAVMLFRRTLREVAVAVAGLLLPALTLCYVNWAAGGEFLAPVAEPGSAFIAGTPLSLFLSTPVQNLVLPGAVFLLDLTALLFFPLGHLRPRHQTASHIHIQYKCAPADRRRTVRSRRHTCNRRPRGGAFGRPAALYVRAHPPGDRPSPLPAIARLCRH